MVAATESVYGVARKVVLSGLFVVNETYYADEGDEVFERAEGVALNCGGHKAAFLHIPSVLNTACPILGDF